MTYADRNKYLEYLVEEYSDMVYRLALSRTRHKEEAEDVYQEVFLRIARKTPEFENTIHEKAWFIKVTINCSKNAIKSMFKETSICSDVGFDLNEGKHDVYYEVLKLPLKYRTVIHLFYYEGYKIEEISKMLDVKGNTVKSQLARAREKLKMGLEWEEGK